MTGWLVYLLAQSLGGFFFAAGLIVGMLCCGWFALRFFDWIDRHQ